MYITVESVSKTYGKQVEKIVLFQTENAPVKNPDYDKIVNDLEDEIAALKGELVKAQEAEKKLIEEEIEHLEQQLTRKEDWYWQVDEKEISEYEAQVPSLYISPGPSPDEPWDENNSIAKLLKDYINGALSLEEFIRRADQRVQMDVLEGE